MSRSERARPRSTTLKASDAYSSDLLSSGGEEAGVFTVPGAALDKLARAISASAPAASSKTSSVVARKVARASSARMLPCRMVSIVSSACR